MCERFPLQLCRGGFCSVAAQQNHPGRLSKADSQATGPRDGLRWPDQLCILHPPACPSPSAKVLSSGECLLS